MARVVVATAEVQVNADVRGAESGLEGLTESFKKIGRNATRAAESAEAAFFGTARSMEGGFKQIISKSEDLVASMAKGGQVSRIMGESLEKAVKEARELGAVDIEAGAIEALGVFKQIVGVIDEMGGGLESAKIMAARLAEEAEAVAEAIREADRAAERLADAFRDVGRDIDLAMNGGLEGLQDDIRETIRRLNDMGGEFKDVGVIGERALDGITGAVDADINDVYNSLKRLERQLHSVESAGGDALDELAADARRAEAAVHGLDRATDRASRSFGGLGSVSRRMTGDIRGLTSVLGTAGVGYAMVEAGRFGLSMTVELEKAEAMFLGLTGSVEGASDMLERMVTFARDTPYNLASVTKSAAQLLAVGDGFGVTTTNIEDYLTTFGEAITMTAGGDEQFERIVRVFGQMSSSGKVLGQDMTQLAQNLPGYEVWQALADGAGTSVEELRRLQNIGQLDELLTGNEAVRILVEGMKNIPGAAGAMERRMDTLGGALEKFKETAQLAVSEGLEPFSETAQDVLSSQVILDSVEGLSNAFGSLLSEGLQAIEPEIAEFAAAVEKVLVALESWAPVVGEVVGMLGDFLYAIAPVISSTGNFVSMLFETDNALTKVTIGIAALAAPLGPFGIAIAVIAGVSIAVDHFAGAAREAEEVARILAAGQRDVNAAMAEGEPEIHSAAQKAVLDQAKNLNEVYPELVAMMNKYDVTMWDLTSSLTALRTGTGEVTPQFQILSDAIAAIPEEVTTTWVGSSFLEAAPVVEQFETVQQVMTKTSDVVKEEAEDMTASLQIASLDQVAIREEEAKAHRELMEGRAAYDQARREMGEAGYAAARAIEESWGELDEERLGKVKGILKQQADAYQEWEDNINSSTDGAALSLSGLAESSNNDINKMIADLNTNSAAVAGWKGNIATAAAGVGASLGLTEKQTAEFAGTLGEVGIEFAPALAMLVADAENGGAKLEEFYNSTAMSAAVMDTSLVDSTQDAAGAVPSLAEQMSDGVISIEDVLKAIPAAMEAEGINFEDAAAAIDASDELTIVGREAVNGLVAELEAGIRRTKIAGANLGAAISGGAGEELMVYSPSRVMMEIGFFAAEGLIQALLSKREAAARAAAELARAVADGTREAMADMWDGAESRFSTATDLASAASDQMTAVWDKFDAKIKNNEINAAIKSSKADVKEALAELAAAKALTGAAGKKALKKAEDRVAKAEKLLGAAEAVDATADLAAKDTMIAFKRAGEDAAAAVKKGQKDESGQADLAAKDALLAFKRAGEDSTVAVRSRQQGEKSDLSFRQKQEIEQIQLRIAEANRNLDPIARAQAEADLDSRVREKEASDMNERHEAEMLQMRRVEEDRTRILQLGFDNEKRNMDERHTAEMLQMRRVGEDEAKFLQLRLDNEDELRELAIKSQQDQLKAFSDAAKAMTKEIADAVKSYLALQASVKKAEESLRDDWLDRFKMLVGGGSKDTNKVLLAGQNAGLTAAQIREITKAAGVVALTSSAEVKAAAATAAGMAAAEIDRILAQVGGALPVPPKPVKHVPISSPLRTPPKSTAKARNAFSGPLITMRGTVIQNSTDADLVAQRTIAALSAAGMRL